MQLIKASRLFYYQLPLIERAQIAKYQIESALRFGERIYGLDERLRELNVQYRGLHDPLQYVFEDLERYRYVLVHSHSQPPMSPFLPLAGMTEHELQSLKPEDVKGAVQQDFLRFNCFQSSPSLTRVNLAQTQATQQSQDEAQNTPEDSTQQQNTTGASAGSGTSAKSTPQPPVVQTQEQVEDRHWLALKYQTPAGIALAGESYTVTLADGSEIKGVLDDKGEARLDNIVAGKAKVELGEATPELDALRSEIQHTLNTIIDEREAEAERIEQELNDMGELAATGELVAIGLKSVWSGLTDTLSFLGNALVKTAESAYYLSPAKRLTNLMQAGWQSYQAGELNEADWYAYLANNYQQQDYQDLVELLGFDPKDVDPQVFSQAYEITTLLLADDETRELFAEFGQAYFASTSSTGWAEVAGGAVFEIVLAALLLVFTAGLGVAAQLAAKVKHADKLKALGTQLQQLGKLLKQKGRAKTLDTQTNKQVIATQALPDGVKLEAKPEVTHGNVYHATTSAGATQGVLNGVDPKFLNPNSRFGAAFYVAENPGTTLVELAHHNVVPTHGIRFEFNAIKAKILDFTDPLIALKWEYSGGPISSKTQNIGEKAISQGYDVIRFYSERSEKGINNAILDNFDELLVPKFVSPME